MEALPHNIPDEFHDMELACFLVELPPELRQDALRSMPKETLDSLPEDFREQFLAESPEFAAESIEDMGPMSVIASLTPKSRLDVVIGMAQVQQSDVWAVFVADEFNEIRKKFLRRFGEYIFQSVASLGWTGIDMELVPLDGEVQRRFMSNLELDTCFLSPALHGTRPENLESIYAKGLLVGGNGVGIAHGAAHGNGVYVANLDNPGLALGFTYGCNKLLVCGVLHQRRTNPMVHSHGNAKVIKDSSHVVPLFLVSSTTQSHQGLHPQSIPVAPADPAPVCISTLFSTEAAACSGAAPRWAGRTAQVLISNTVWMLRDAGFSATELRDAGFPAAALGLPMATWSVQSASAQAENTQCCFACSLAMDSSALNNYKWIHPDNGDEIAEVSCHSCGNHASGFYVFAALSSPPQ